MITFPFSSLEEEPVCVFVCVPVLCVCLCVNAAHLSLERECALSEGGSGAMPLAILPLARRALCAHDTPPSSSSSSSVFNMR